MRGRARARDGSVFRKCCAGAANRVLISRKTAAVAWYSLPPPQRFSPRSARCPKTLEKSSCSRSGVRVPVERDHGFRWKECLAPAHCWTVSVVRSDIGRGSGQRSYRQQPPVPTPLVAPAWSSRRPPPHEAVDDRARLAGCRRRQGVPSNCSGFPTDQYSVRGDAHESTRAFRPHRAKVMRGAHARTPVDRSEEPDIAADSAHSARFRTHPKMLRSSQGWPGRGTAGGFPRSAPI
jgi:hypothetical protein